MTVKPRLSRPRFRISRRPSPGPVQWSFWLDLGMLAVWSALLFKYWLSGQIVLLLHPDFIWLTIIAGFVLLTMSIFVVQQYLGIQPTGSSADAAASHFSLLPKGWSNMILIVVGLIGLVYTPRAFTSDVALQRGVTETVVVTRSQPQAFRVSVNPREKSITDWVRTLNVYPEPDAYSFLRAFLFLFLSYHTVFETFTKSLHHSN